MLSLNILLSVKHLKKITIIKIKTIEEQGRKQVETIEEHGKQLVNSNAFTVKEESIPLDKQEEIFYNLVVERTRKTEKLHNSVNFQNLINHFKGPPKDIDFNDFTDAITLIDDIKSKKIRFEDAEKNQMEFELKLSSVRIGGDKSDKQLREIENITNFYKSREQVIKFYNDYLKMVNKA